MFTKQVFRRGGQSPDHGRGGGAGRANTKKDLVTSPIGVSAPHTHTKVRRTGILWDFRGDSGLRCQTPLFEKGIAWELCGVRSLSIGSS